MAEGVAEVVTEGVAEGVAEVLTKSEQQEPVGPPVQVHNESAGACVLCIRCLYVCAVCVLVCSVCGQQQSGLHCKQDMR